MTEILEKSGNFMRGKKWEPCFYSRALCVTCSSHYMQDKNFMIARYTIPIWFKNYFQYKDDSECE